MPIREDNWVATGENGYSGETGGRQEQSSIRWIKGEASLGAVFVSGHQTSYDRT